jgi:hypothetical protein
MGYIARRHGYALVDRPGGARFPQLPNLLKRAGRL